MLFEGHSIKIPHRINVSSNDKKIEDVFKKHMKQPPLSIVPYWNPNLWLFKNETNILCESFQYELRFFADEVTMNTQLKAEKAENKKNALHFLDESFEVTSPRENGCTLL